MEPTERGSGRTTKQLLGLSEGAFFVCAHDRHAIHTRRLADHLGRRDIRVVTVAECISLRKFQGLPNFRFDIDHATNELMFHEGNNVVRQQWWRAWEGMQRLQERSMAA